MTICVLGMHRSGTSMIARLLNACGMNLGKPEDIMEPHSIDNPDGYWENKRIVAINDSILEVFGGSDQWPPEMIPGWAANPRLGLARETAQELIEEQREEQVWGWKDPRTMLTLPFWQNLIPDLKYILIYRNPLEVALSLGKRQDYVDAFYAPNLNHSLHLWTQYHEAALAAMPPDTMVCSYEAFFSNPEPELRRVLDALGMQPSEETVAEAAKHINPELRRNRIDGSFLNESFVPEQTRSIYVDLERRAGATAPNANLDPLPTYRKLMAVALKQMSAQTQLVIGSRSIADTVQSANADLSEGVERYKEAIEQQRENLERHSEELKKLRGVIEQQQVDRREAEARIKELQIARQRLEVQCHEKDQLVASLRQQNAEEANLRNHLISTHQQELNDLAQILRHRSLLERFVKRLKSR